MNKYLTALVVLVGSISGVAHAACGPNGCSANSAQFNAIYGESNVNYGQRANNAGQSYNYGNSYTKPCNCTKR